MEEYNNAVTLRLGLTTDGTLKDLITNDEKRDYINALVREIDHMEEKLRAYRHKAKEAQKKYKLKKSFEKINHDV